ncbi:TldD/PmbA family protein [Eubacteriales bacterium OttesenSCG-928-N13]|nr:TldD/PmbA family protein [Eubacteriales bacterium OttesenSCG-928-N13]
MVSIHALERALACALDQGGDFAEFFIEDTVSRSIALVDGTVDTATTSRKHGAGLRIYDGLNSLYVHTNDTSPDGLMKLAKQAASAVGNADAQARVIALQESRAANLHPILQLPGTMDGARRSQLVHDAYRVAKAYSPEISQVRSGISDSNTHVLIANSDGLCVCDDRTYTRMRVEAVATKGTESQTGAEAPGAMMGYELFESRVDVEQMARMAAEQAVTMLHADFCPAGQMPVVIGGGFGGVIFHEACGHSLEATAVAFGNSEFAGKLGQRIASDVVSAVDDGTLPNEWGSLNIDDEGTPTTRLVLIEDGILKNFMIDRLNGKRMGMPVTGSARRQDYTFAPTSRMRNTFILPGSSTDEEIIRTMGDGLFAKKMGGGSVNTVTSEFNFAVSEGYLVRDGKITCPVRGATLIGKGAEVLMRIDRVGQEMSMGQGMCGSLSGSIPTNVGQPTIRVSSLTVGGR